jgi:hemolysin III
MSWTSPTLSAPEPTAAAVTAPLLYDSRRGVHYPRPRLRGWLHLVWFEVSLVAGTLMLAIAHGTAQITAVAVYTVSVSGLFGTSALYHRGTWSIRAARRLQRLDHVMIFVLIAGTATPAFLLGVRGALGLVAVTVMWALTMAAALMHVRWMNAPEKLVGATFIALGWAAGMALPAVWIRFGVAPALLIITGGLLYTVGAVSYHRRRPDPLPAIFGYHEVFHSYVCVAAACQYIAIAIFIL